MITEVKVLPPRPNLEQYKKQANELLKSLRAGDADAIRRVATYHPQYAKDANVTPDQVDFTLSDAQWALAREYGFERWTQFADHLEAVGREHFRGLTL